MKPLVGIVGIIYDLETPLSHEVEKAGVPPEKFSTEHVLYTNHNYHKLLHKLDCHLTVISPEADPDIVTQLDMLLIPGGPDVDPAFYGQTPHPQTEFDTRRDIFEKNALEVAMETEIPILGVCRGFQMINVALGGSLQQHLPDVSNQVPHRPIEGPVVYAHSVETDGWLRQQFGKELMVNSWHHQGIDKLAPGLEPLAWAPDGVIEAYQSTKGAPPIFSVQWHPELLQDKESLTIISSYLERVGLKKKTFKLS